MKVHIALVGGQPAPVYHGIVATKPDKIVFIYSKDSRNVVDALRKEINIEEDKQDVLHPTDPNRILARAKFLAEKYKEEEITVNISSGLKSWSHLFGIVFEKMSNAAIVYMDQNNVFWNYRTMKSQSDFKFDMHILFRLYGNPLENYKRFEDYTDEDRRAVEKIEKIRVYNYSYFNKLTVLLSREDQHKLRTRENDEFKHSNGSFIEWNKVNKTVKICLYKKMGNAYKSIEITSPNVIALVFNSGWFEYKVAQMLALWDRAKEICMNCRFRFKSNYADKNEVDIIVNAGTKILFVECKVQIAHVTDIDKFRNVIKIYGGLGSKGLFITHAAMPDIARQKCEENGIIPFSLVDYSCPEKVLTMILNSELFNMNVR